MPRRLGIGWGIGLVFLFVMFMIIYAYAGQNGGLNRAGEIKALFRAIGFSALPASSEYAGSQSSFEGISSCLKDTPGGYCYKTDNADTEQVPFAECDYFQLEIK